MKEQLTRAKVGLANLLESNYTVTGWAMAGMVAISFLTGALFIHETTDYTVVKKDAKQYAWTADQLCNNMGYDLAYGYESTDQVVNCGAYSNNRTDGKVNIGLIFDYIGENPEQFEINGDTDR